jgi:hypothetical protein
MQKSTHETVHFPALEHFCNASELLLMSTQSELFKQTVSMSIGLPSLQPSLCKFAQAEAHDA